MSAPARAIAVALLLGAVVACGGDGGGAPEPLWGEQPAGTLDLRAALAKHEVALLEEVELRIDLFVGAGLDVAFAPAVPEGFAGRVAELPARPLAGGTWRRFVLTLQPTRLGELVVPAFRAEATGGGPVATSAEQTLVVASVLQGADAAVEAPAPPFPPRSNPWPWVATALAACALLAGALLWWRRRPALRRPASTPVPAHVKALRALARLRQAPRSSAEQVDAFYVEVSHILRVYLEERFGLHAPDRTTDEFLAELEGGDALSTAQRGRLSEFLRQCDLVKFARALPSEDVHQSTFRTAEELVEATRADRAPERGPRPADAGAGAVREGAA